MSKQLSGKQKGMSEDQAELRRAGKALGAKVAAKKVTKKPVKKIARKAAPKKAIKKTVKKRNFAAKPVAKKAVKKSVRKVVSKRVVKAAARKAATMVTVTKKLPRPTVSARPSKHHRKSQPTHSAFGNRMFLLNVAGTPARLVFDRGTTFVELSDGKEWHSLRNLIGFADRMTYQDTASMPEPLFETMAQRWTDLLSALNSEGISDFESQVGAEVARRLIRDAKARRSRLAN